MGQIVSLAAKPKRCNANQLSQLGFLAAGLHVLVSSDNSMNAAGQGNFDCYIVGDGTTAATALTLKPIDEEKKAEMLEGLLDIEETSSVVTKGVAYVQNKGYVTTYNTINTGNTAYRYSDPIFLKAGETLTMKGITPTSVARISSYNPDTEALTMIAAGTSSGTNSASYAYENTYTAQQDMYVIVSWFWGYYQFEMTKTYTAIITTSKVDDVDNIAEAIELESGSEPVTEPVSLTLNTGYWAKQDNNGLVYINNGSTYSRSNDFLLKEGDVLSITTENAAESVAVLCVLDDIAGGNAHRALVWGNGGSQSFTYTVPVDGYYAVSYLTNKGITITKTYTKTLGGSARLDEIESNIADISSSVNGLDSDMDEVKDTLYDIVNDDLTQGFQTGFIHNNGTIKTSSGYGYKEFAVRAGAVITYTAGVHPYFAVIAKKLTATTYETLVSTTSYEVETFNYIATEDMTIAVSFRTNASRSISIVTNNVESNTASINNIASELSELDVQDIDLGFMFNKVAVIGDSMACATMDGYSAPLGASWLSFLAKRWDCTNKQHYAAPGTTTYAWLNNTTYGLGKMLADETIYNAYFIAYGHNDSMSIGEASDTAAEVTIEGTTPTCASGNTFCAYYKAIINQIRTKAPHAMIFCLPQYDYLMMADHKLYAQAVIDIANLYYNNGDKLVHHLDTGGVPIDDMKLGDHYSTVGYAYIAKRVNEEANKVIYQYRADTEIKNFGVYNL